ncbi:hypothetical protein L6452_32668 [Arctium lappa]|uniref:Uncharacterized protein n=1 Tax=Arctium lappa TaxID=4217 RepID=A0ACB8Z6H1_ARCLA|nr:hypothetical protein L6452_32668 [Arctium lappa]
MDAGVTSVEVESMGQHGVAFDRYADFDGAADPAGISTPQDKDRETEPHLGLEFAYVDAAKTFYNEYAKRVGFTTRVNQIARPTSDVAQTQLEFPQLKIKTGKLSLT